MEGKGDEGCHFERIGVRSRDEVLLKIGEYRSIKGKSCAGFEQSLFLRGL